MKNNNLLKKAQTLIGEEIALLLKQSPNYCDIKGVLNEIDKDGVLILTFTENVSSISDSETYVHIDTVNVIYNINKKKKIY